MVDIDKLQSIKDRIEKMNKQQQIEVLKLFIKYNIDISENSNGTFINLTEIDNIIIQDLEEYISFVSQQNKVLNDIEQKKLDIQHVFFDSKMVIKTTQEYNLE